MSQPSWRGGLLLALFLLALIGDQFLPVRGQIGYPYACTNSYIQEGDSASDTPPPPQCPIPDNDYYREDSRWNGMEGGPSFSAALFDGGALTFCQYGRAGDVLEFNLKDGSGTCAALSATQATVLNNEEAVHPAMDCAPAGEAASCIQPDPANVGSECVWTYTVPDVGCGTDDEVALSTCEPGYGFVAPPSTASPVQCTECPEGMFSTGGTEACLACPPLQASSQQFDVECIACNPTDGKCSECSTGYFQESDGSACRACTELQSQDEDRSCFSGGMGDPMIIGFGSETYLFTGQHNKWYAALGEEHLQSNWRLSVFPTCEDGAQPTYITGASFTFIPPKEEEEAAARDSSSNSKTALRKGGAGGAGRQGSNSKSTINKPKKVSKVLVEVIDDSKYNPEYIKGEELELRAEQILGYGSLRVGIEGKGYVTPGLYRMANGGTVMAFNAYGPCQAKRDIHMMEVLNHEAKLKEASFRRRLSEMAEKDDELVALLAVESQLGRAEDRALCEEWIADKRVTRNLFTEPGSWATVFIFTDTYSFEVDYRQETERCFAHVLDVGFMHKPNDIGVERWSGIIGETQVPRLDGEGKHVLKDRALILSSPKDEDYVVDGPWGTDFVARLDSAWEGPKSPSK